MAARLNVFFCNSSSIWLGKWRKRNPEAVVDEIEYVIKTYKKKPVFFNDNSFNIDLKRVEEFCRQIINRKLKFLWTTPVRAELITPDIAGLMKKSGCYNVGIGIESANNLILEKNEKKRIQLKPCKKKELKYLRTPVLKCLANL